MIKLFTNGSIKLEVNAKVNLALAIKGFANNGYHKLDTIMAEIDLSDTVSVTVRQDEEIRVSYTTGQRYNNDIALKMARIVQKTYHTAGVDIVITKRIPEGVGVGGSSADAAGVARAMSALFDIVISQKVLLSVGSDVPYMVQGGVMRVTECGEHLEPIKLKPLYGVLIYKNGLSVSTKEAFALYDDISGDDCNITDVIAGLEPHNALERAAIMIEPSICELRDLLRDIGFKNVVMTGSGSGYIAYTYEKEMYQHLLNSLNNKKTSDISAVIFEL